jgi:hypothetical protein
MKKKSKICEDKVVTKIKKIDKKKNYIAKEPQTKNKDNCIYLIAARNTIDGYKLNLHAYANKKDADNFINNKQGSFLHLSDYYIEKIQLY